MRDLISIFETVKNGVAKQAEIQNIKSDWENRYYYPLIVSDAKYRNIDKKKAYFMLFWLLLADRQYMANIIRYKEEKIEEKLLAIFSNDPVEAFSRFSKAEKQNDDYIIKICRENNIIIPERDFSQKQLITYIRGIINCAEYLSKNTINGKTTPSIDEMLSKPSNENEFREYIWKTRKLHEMKGVGVAVACNWLKECGADWLGKPDMHVMRVVDAIWTASGYEINRYVPKHNSSKLYLDEVAMVYLFNWAKEADTTPFMLDRALFLYCTGCKFYAEAEPTSESDLIEYIKH